MGLAIGIAAKNDSKGHIVELWRKVSEFEDTPSMQTLGYPPHFTLAIYQNADGYDFRKAVGEIFAKTSQIRVIFDEIKYFDASPLVLWASPKSNHELDQLHAAIHAKIDPQLCDELYRPQAWVAHCTLGTGILETSRKDAMSFASSTIEPFEVVFDTIDLIEFYPIRVIKCVAMAK